jgi:hypothetical protein
MGDYMKKGISLIVLVITIIVIIILSGTVILGLSKNNPITSATEATFKSSLSGYNSELSTYILSEYSRVSGNLDLNNINANNSNEIKQYIKSIPDSDINKYRITAGKLIYIGSNTNEIQWTKDIDISLDVPYVKSGLVLWYDGIYNGGIGVHNDNSSLTKGVWKDLSSLGNDGTLQSFDYNSSNGWITNGLKFNGRPNLVNFNLNIPNTHTVEFIVMPRGGGYNGVFSVASNLTKTYSTPGGSYTDFLFYNTAIGGGSNYLVTGLNYTKQSLFTMTFDGTTSTRTMYHNSVSKSIYYAGGGASGDFSQYTGFLLGNGGWGTLSGEIYAVRVYNRVLTPSEITQNYEIDKVRYGID